MDDEMLFFPNKKNLREWQYKPLQSFRLEQCSKVFSQGDLPHGIRVKK